MKIKPGYVLRLVAGENIVIPTQEAALNFNGIMTLNDTGKFLWEHLQQDISIDNLTDEIVIKYQVSEAEAKKDVQEFIDILKGKNILLDE